jgi:hypothetical protein
MPKRIQPQDLEIDPQAAVAFIRTVFVEVDNQRMSATEFRVFVRESLTRFYPRDREAEAKQAALRG